MILAAIAGSRRRHRRSTSPLLMGFNNDVMDWWTDSSPFLNIANGDSPTDEVSEAIPYANRDPDGTVNSVPPGHLAVNYTFQIPGSIQPYKLTWDDVGGADSVTGIYSEHNVNSVTADLTGRSIVFTPNNSQVTDRSAAPGFVLQFGAGKHPKNLVCRPVADPGGILDPRWQSNAKAIITPGGFMRFVKLLPGTELNSDPIHEASGNPGVAIASITHVGTTATLTTTAPHDLITGHSVEIVGAAPAAYNSASFWQITVTGPDTFTFVMASDPGSDATSVGTYTWGDENFQYPRLAFPNAASEPGTLLGKPIFTAANRNQNPNDVKYNDGLPIEMCIQMATGVNCDAWYNAPWNADETYYLGDGTNPGVADLWAQFALASGNKVGVEPSLEVWNPGYKQFHQCANEAAINGITQHQRYAQKGLEIFGYFETAFNALGIGPANGASNKLIRILAWQNESSPNIADELLDFGTTNAHVDMIATATYYGDNGPGSTMATAGFARNYVGPVAPLAAAISTDIDRIIGHAVPWQAKVIGRGKLYGMYEGGSTIVLDDAATMTALQTDVSAYNNELRYLQQLELRLGSVAPVPLNSYSFIFPVTTPNAWGLMGYLYNGTDKANSPRYAAHIDFINGVRVLSDATGAPNAASTDMPIGTSLGFVGASAYGVTWSLADNDSGHFSINSATGEFSTAADLSGVVTGSHSVTVVQTHPTAGTHSNIVTIPVVPAIPGDNFNSAAVASVFAINGGLLDQPSLSTASVTVTTSGGNLEFTYTTGAANCGADITSVNTVDLTQLPKHRAKFSTNDDNGHNRGLAFGTPGGEVWLINRHDNSVILQRLDGAGGSTNLGAVGGLSIAAYPWVQFRYDDPTDTIFVDVAATAGDPTAADWVTELSAPRGTLALTGKVGLMTWNNFGSAAGAQIGFDAINSAP